MCHMSRNDAVHVTGAPQPSTAGTRILVAGGCVERRANHVRVRHGPAPLPGHGGSGTLLFFLSPKPPFLLRIPWGKGSREAIEKSRATKIGEGPGNVWKKLLYFFFLARGK